MTKNLAVIAPQVGVRSETFIRRHMQDLHPCKTFVIARNADLPQAGHWQIDAPTLFLDEQNSKFATKALSFVRKRIIPTQEASPWSLSMRNFLVKHDIRVIMSEYLNFSLRFFEVARELGIPFFAHAHGYDISSALRNPEFKEKYLLYNDAEGVITISDVSRRKLIEIGLDPSKIHVIPCGVDVPSAPINREEGSIVRCLAVGRLVGKKAPIYLLEAFRRASEKCPNLHLDYIGTGELMPAVRQYIRAFNLQDQVSIHGGQPSEVVQKYMRNADIFLQHSMVDFDSGDEEGLPVAILEAMSNALPIISTFHAGIPEAVINSETGLLVEEGDFISMAKKIVLLAKDSNLRYTLGAAGWQRSQALFSWEREKNSLRKIMQIE